MQTTPDSPRPKRTAAKPRAAAGPTVTVKKSRARKSTPTEAAAPISTAESESTPSAMAPATEDLGGQIAVAAYYLAEERGFAPGHELDDWLEAERRLRGAPRAGLS